MTIVVDIQGRDLVVGSQVAFAGLTYRRAEVRLGQVVEVDPTRSDAIKVYEAAKHRAEWHVARLLVLIGPARP